MPTSPRRPTALLAALAVVVACVPTPAGRPTAPPGGPTVVPSVAPTVVPSPTGPTPIPSFVRPTPTPLPTFLAYTVAAGDSLTSIARRFETTPRSIAFWNRDTYPSLDPDSEAYEPDRIALGWVLRIIPGVELDELELPERTPAPTAAPSPTEGG